MPEIRRYMSLSDIARLLETTPQNLRGYRTIPDHVVEIGTERPVLGWDVGDIEEWASTRRVHPPTAKTRKENKNVDD